MRTMLSLLSPLATAAVFSTAAMAQQATTIASARPVANRAAAEDVALVRTVAVYTFVGPHATGMPTQVTVADSLGRLVATLRVPSLASPRPMLVESLDTGLLLQAETPAGTFTLVLYEYGQQPEGAIVGRWILGDREGKLRAAAR